MAATVYRCEGCGRENVATRSHARWCRGKRGEACRKAWARESQRSSAWPPGFERAEEALIKQARAGYYDRPEDALARIAEAWPTTDLAGPLEPDSGQVAA